MVGKFGNRFEYHNPRASGWDHRIIAPDGAADVCGLVACAKKQGNQGEYHLQDPKIGEWHFLFE